jgi:hypothetical protein
MTIIEYLEEVKESLLTNTSVGNLEIIRERATASDGYLRGRLTFIDGSSLQFSEYIQRRSDTEIQVATYSYNWVDIENQLICRWDNTPHFSGLPNFPHHIHRSNIGEAEPGKLMDIFIVIDEITQHL